MKLEIKGKGLLDITRAKAKQYEFGIDEVHHLALREDPKRLLVFTIGVLGELAALESRAGDDRWQLREILKEQLILAGQYFESMSAARLSSGTDEYLRILSSASYYLADMPGSALVLAKTVPELPNILTDSGIERLLVWVLKSDLSKGFKLVQNGPYNHHIVTIARTYRSFIHMEADFSDILDELINFRTEIYQRGTDREVLLADIINALILRKIENSSLVCLPRFTGIEIERWKHTLANDQFMKEFWPAQRLVGDLGVLKGASAVIQMPTSAGKTKSAELIIRSAFLSNRAKLAVVVAPFRALCREISQGFAAAFEYDSVNVNELRDITNIDENEQEFLKFLLGEAYKGPHDCTILVSTPEKLVYLLRHEPSLAEKIELLIFDEGHQFDSGKRGVTYELLIASLKKTISPSAQKVLISAVMSNAESIGEWLNGESGKHIQGSNFLPSIKSVAFLSWITDMGQLSYLDQTNKFASGLYVPRLIQQTNLGHRPGEKEDLIFPAKDKPQQISCYLGLKLCHQGPVAVFCGDKKAVISHSETIVDIYERGFAIPKPSTISNQDELTRIAFLSKLHFSDEHIYSKAIPLGILPHSSAVPNGLRIAIEWAMDKNAAHFVICTSTLAQGVNLPIKYLLISQIVQGGRKISAREFQNLIGRAGRSGYHTEGGIIFTNSKVYDGRHTWQGQTKWWETLALLDFTNSEACLSKLMEITKPFKFENAKGDLLNFIARPSARRAEWLRWSEETGNDVSKLMIEMDSKESTLNSVESYFLSILKDDLSLLNIDVFSDLVRETLAYHLGEDEEKEKLLQLFSVIHKRLQSIPKEKFDYLGKALLGLDQLLYIEDWIDSNLWDLQLCESSIELLDFYWAVIFKFATDNIITNLQPAPNAVDLAKRWCKGDSYFELLTHAYDNQFSVQAKSKKYKITQEHIVDFCSALAYDGMLLVGAIADIIEGKGIDDELAVKTRTLQNQLKLGLADELHVWIYGKGYADREVCKHIGNALHKVTIGKNVVDYQILKNNPILLAEALSVLPKVFSEIKVS